MRVGYYSHLTGYISEGYLYVPSFIEIYIRTLNEAVENVVLFIHIEKSRGAIHDKKIDLRKVDVINIGRKRHMLIRSYFDLIAAINIRRKVHDVDYLIVRSPTPLLFWIYMLVPKSKLRILLVADILGSMESLSGPFLKRSLLRFHLMISERIENKIVGEVKSYANSVFLQEKYRKKNIDLNIYGTSTLTKTDFYLCTRELTRPLKLLFVGRIAEEKGIMDILECIVFLRRNNIECFLDIVGWDDSSGLTMTKRIEEFIERRALGNSIRLKGKKSIGEELNSYYRKADIFVSASYSESFPRTIWEAMANSLPVVATRVGAIPIVLSHKENAMLADIRKPNELAACINELYFNEELRYDIINRAYSLAKEQRLDLQITKMINNIK